MSEEQPRCPYCHTTMIELGFEEGSDSLGTYIAQTFVCESCTYRLERNPVYVDSPDDSSGFERRIVDD